MFMTELPKKVREILGEEAAMEFIHYLDGHYVRQKEDIIHVIVDTGWVDSTTK